MNKRKRKIKQKYLIIPFCEGEAEVNVFNFLKITYSNKIIKFRKPENLNGVRDFKEFKRKYYKCIKAFNLKPANDYKKVGFLFIIDNDLEDSKKIENFILKERCLVQLFNPNLEGLILSIIGKKQICSTDKENFRKKCKVNFEKHFKCEAHKLKENQLNDIFYNTN
ncbi:MAG: hypothetical protein PF488_01435, partial [Patescibacteria group bacterium]|nr:hypothetical protein [Patescibacteria group bacterium]